MRRSAPFHRTAPLYLALFASCATLPGCAMSKQPYTSSATTAPTTPNRPDPTCAWHRIDDKHTGTATADSIAHTISDANGDATLRLIPDGPPDWDIRNTGNGLSFLHISESTRIPGTRGITGRWAGWHADEPITPVFLVVQDGDEYRVETTDRLYLPQPDGTLTVTSDAGTLFTIFIPTDRPPRGTALVLSGLDAGHNTKRLVNELTEDGWAVVQIYNLVFEFNLDNAIPFTDTSSPEKLGADIAQLFESRHCTTAGAADTTLAILAEELPSVAGKPLVLVGLSAGALYAPGLAATLPQPPDATVLVTGGASVLRVLQGTSLATWHGEARKTKRFLDDNIDAIDAAFLAASPRDPHNTAPLLDRKRTLIIHARNDGFVPHETGDTLWERAGRPERWIFPGGHAGFYLTFNWHADDIAEWIDQATRGPTEAVRSSPSPAPGSPSPAR